ncbi:MAG: Transcriptional regulator, AsnC family, partial [uncultured Nocardioidaceae bacterium]
AFRDQTGAELGAARRRARRGLEGDRRGAAARRATFLRGDRQGGGALRGRGASAGAATHRRWRDAGGRGHRPLGARLRPPGDDRDQGEGCAGADRRPAGRHGRGRLRGDHGRFLRPAGRGRVRERRAPAGGPVHEGPADPGRGVHRDLHVPQAPQADLLVGRPL